MSSDLRKCPFCGGNTEIYWSRKNKYWQVSCEGTDIADGDQGCGMEGPETHAFPNSSTPPDKSKDEALREAIEEWNNYSSPQLDEVIEALDHIKGNIRRSESDERDGYIIRFIDETISNLRGERDEKPNQ